MAALAERISERMASVRCSDELDALAAIYGDDVALTARGFTAHLGAITLTVVLPDGYPESAAPIATIEAAGRTRGVLRDAERRLAAHVSPGEESALALLQEVEACVAAASAAATPVAAVTIDDSETYAVVGIDHMNAFASYAATLERLSAANALRGALWATPAPRPNAPQRREGAVLVLQGRDAGVSEFLKALRSESVDVDSKGKRCKERRAVVERRSPLAAGDARLREAWAVRSGGGPERLARCVAGDLCEPLFRDDGRGGCAVALRARPGKSATSATVEDGVLVVDVAAAARDGAANAEIRRFFAAAFGATQADVALVAGAKGREKVVRCAGVGAAEAEERLRRVIDG